MRFLFVIFLLCATSWAQIVEVHTLNEVRDHFEGKDRSTFAVFDIDMVLIQPGDPAFQLLNIERYYPIAEQIILSVPPEKRDILYTLTSFYYDSVLVDDKYPLFFHELKEKGIPALGLTASLTGSLLYVPQLEVWKSKHLCDQGIYFEKMAPYGSSLTFCNLPAYRGNYPQFFEGVLFTNGGFSCTKGTLFVTFLKDAHLHPHEVIFADDKKDNLISVEKALLEYDPSIHFIGLHYLGARYFPSQYISEEEFADRWETLAAQAIILD